MTKLRAFDHGDPLLPKGVLPRPLRPYARARRDGQVPLCKCKAGAPEALPAVCHRSRPQQTPSTTTNTLVGQTRSRLCRCGVRLLRRPYPSPQPLHPRLAKATQAKRSAYYHVKPVSLIFLLLPFLETCVSRGKMRKRARRWERDS